MVAFTPPSFGFVVLLLLFCLLQVVDCVPIESKINELSGVEAVFLPQSLVQAPPHHDLLSDDFLNTDSEDEHYLEYSYNSTEQDVDPSDPTTRLQKRRCEFSIQQVKWVCDMNMPKFAEILEKIRGRTKSKHPTFYVNMNDPNLAKGSDEELAWLVGWMNRNVGSNKWYWWGDAIDKYWFVAQSKHLKDNRAYFAARGYPLADQIFAKCVFQALAMLNKNEDVYFHTREGKDWDQNTIWHQIEYPYVTHSQKIKRIWRVDPSPPGTCEKEVLWEKGKNAARTPLWSCPRSLM